MPQPYCKRSLTLHVLPFFLLLFITPTVFAADQDTSLRLNQTIEYRANQQERELLKDALSVVKRFKALLHMRLRLDLV